ncbi:50S ribosomal protein L15 [Tichowtungia aerotolerans]|uniref:Large ribosomal subunit protein uL15 n=1 Tax=Tichowtungia aerotolerans TaxID=2697043 RepID=A0A6P1M7T7_9BACT|nr:50S ribosomal protein L15 [Tichowtungia aerotolerans]QHI68238.1 50S ribosomal protein L15 [Tichowtungia aerotolerans]
MDLHTLKPAEGSTHRKLRVGRGRASGKGKTSARGQKGQMSRSGSTHKPLFEGGQMPMARRIPIRGFKNINRKEFAPVNLAALDKFDDGAEITEAVLREAGLVKGRFDGVKILGNGELTKKVSVKASAFSAAAKEKIEAAGGSCETV